MTKGITRRAVLAALPATLAARNSTVRKTRPLPNTGEFVRFADPTTETTVVRLTNPASASVLPAATNRFISAKDRFLLFSSDRGGRMAPYHLDLRTGVVSPIIRTENLEPKSLCLDTRGRLLYLIDGGLLKEVALSTRRFRVLAEGVSGFSTNGPACFAIVKEGQLELLNGGRQPLAEKVSSWCLVRPDGKGCVFGRDVSPDEREFWYVSLAPLTSKPALLAKGLISNPFWSSDSRSLLLLREVPGRNALISEIHEVVPETGVERRVTPTSQFAAFSPNENGSVFVGASSSKAQPTVILLLRSAQREFTLCEHRASHPNSVSPVFSPDSRRVYFESDHQGKSALYSVNVELLVEPTAAGTV